MIKLEKTQVFNFENAVRGARNPLNSWGRMDSHTDNGIFVFGPNDLDLAKRLCKAGSDHRKFIRQIFISVDITAPLYWWKEYDTYKVGTESYKQMRTCTVSYENAVAMYNSRKNHKLDEWHTFCDWVLELPYFKELFAHLISE